MLTSCFPTIVGESNALDVLSARPPQRTNLVAGRLSRLRAIVLLCGVVRPRSWLGGIGRSVLDLPICERLSLLGQWVDQRERIALLPGIERLALQVLVDRNSAMPQFDRVASLHSGGLDALRLERDTTDYRGTGGVLKDLSSRYDEDDFLLVATGAQVLLRSIEDLVALLASQTQDVAIMDHDDGTAAGLMWIRCGCLRTVPEVGFVDLKEQALPQMAKRCQVEVVRLPRVGMPVRTPAEYVAACRHYRLWTTNSERIANPFAEDWSPLFSIIEDGARVDESAEVHDSIVLKGARLEQGAVVVRSVIAPGAVIRARARVVDQFVSPPA